MPVRARTPVLSYPAPTQQVTLPEPGFLQSVGCGMLCLYLFLLYSRLHDYVYYLHLPAIIMTVLLVVVILSGELPGVVRRSSTLWVLGLTVCLGMSIPLSVWRGGAAEAFASLWLKTALTFVCVAALVTTIGQVRAVCTSVAVGALLSATRTDNQVFGRVSADSVRYGDSNEFAQLLLVGMTLLLAYATRPANKVVFRAMAAVGVSVELVVFLRSGSRGGLVGFFVVLLAFFLSRNSAGGRMALVLVVVMGAGLSAVLLPRSVRDRYLSVVGVDVESTEGQVAAAGSAASRHYLLKQSLWITLKNPLVGAGIGMFAVAENNAAMERGLPRGNWHETHNMYTQVSSEAGVPALICFLGILVCGFRSLSRARQYGAASQDPLSRDVRHMAQWIRLALIGMASSGFFLSVAYSPELYIVLAVSISVGNIAAARPLQPVQPAAGPPWAQSSFQRADAFRA
jgi:hypothetical protein